MSAEHDATELQNEVYRLEARVAELEAQLRAAREQEPVAYSITDGAHTIARMAKHVDPRRLTAVNVTPLYAAPVPQPQEAMPDMPAGWVFFSADGSLQSSDPLRPISAMLVRDKKGRSWWHSLTDDEKEATALYANGVGRTLTAAIQNAIEVAILAAKEKK